MTFTLSREFEPLTRHAPGTFLVRLNTPGFVVLDQGVPSAWYRRRFPRRPGNPDWCEVRTFAREIYVETAPLEATGLDRRHIHIGDDSPHRRLGAIIDYYEGGRGHVTSGPLYRVQDLDTGHAGWVEVDRYELYSDRNDRELAAARAALAGTK